MNRHLPLSRSLLWIFLITACVMGFTLSAWFYYLHVKKMKQNDDQYHIVAIVQNGHHVDGLKTVHLAELLHLSLDDPVNLYQFDVREGERALLKDPLICRASIKKIVPGTLLVDYAVRQPIAFVADFTNTAIDKQGYLFPFRPFYTPKNLPSLILGLNAADWSWGSSVRSLVPFQTALDFMDHFHCAIGNAFELKKIDVSRIECNSFGKKEVVVELQIKESEERILKKTGKITLRLNVENLDQNLADFNRLYGSVLEKMPSKDSEKESLVVDLRIAELGFIYPVRAVITPANSRFR